MTSPIPNELGNNLLISGPNQGIGPNRAIGLNQDIGPNQVIGANEEGLTMLGDCGQHFNFCIYLWVYRFDHAWRLCQMVSENVVNTLTSAFTSGFTEKQYGSSQYDVTDCQVDESNQGPPH
ncbi:hypothetical protein M8J76_007660 [Diaphorina citri]|nr:hypothetical protein M8J76_007660 [Diaphorina citri]